MFKFTHPFTPIKHDVLLKGALAKATEDLFEAQLRHEDWQHTLALYTARVNRLRAELESTKVGAGTPITQVGQTLKFPPLDLLNDKVTGATK